MIIVVMPDDNTENVENLRLVKKVEGLIHDTEAWAEFLSPDLEELMFGDSKYLENNAFSTSHQSVNVYELPEKCYEVRTEDTAVDVQIHKRSSSVDVSYDGKLKSHTVKKTEGMFIPLIRNGQEKMVSVSAVPKDRIIYISKDMFKLYEMALSEPEGIDLRSSFF